MSTKKWFLKKQSWKGPNSRSWRVRDDVDTDLKAVRSDHGRLTQITLPFQGQGGGVEKLVNLTYQASTGFYRGSIHDDQLLVLLEVNEAARSMRGIVYSLKESPVVQAARGLQGTDPEPIGIWGAEEREGNEWPLKP
jgi:hypothetical protein